MAMVHRSQDQIKFYPQDMLLLLWRKLWIIILATIAGGCLLWGIVYELITPLYSAHITIYVNNTTEKDVSMITTNDIAVSGNLVHTYSEIITSNTALERVIKRSGTDITVEDLRDNLSTEARNATEVFDLTVMDSDPERAALLANTFADVIVDEIVKIVTGSSAKIIDYATVPTKIASPNYMIFISIGCILGFIGSILVIILKDIFDFNIHSETDLEFLDIPVLGVIPSVHQK